MVKKTGQRKFLHKMGFTTEEIDHMSPGDAHNIISNEEKRRAEVRRHDEEKQKRQNMTNEQWLSTLDSNHKMFEISAVCFRIYNSGVTNKEAKEMFDHWLKERRNTEFDLILEEIESYMNK